MSPRAADEDEIDEAPHPRATAVLFGQAAAEAGLLAAYRSGRVPHAFLIAGPKGIGKATLAYRMARFVLAHPDPAAPEVQAATSLCVDAERSGGAPDRGAGAARSPRHRAHAQRQGRAAQADRRRRHPPDRGVFRLDRGRGRLAHRHRRCGRRTQPFRRQCAAEGAGGAAAARAVAPGQSFRGARAADAALALPHPHAAPARPRPMSRRRWRRRPGPRRTIPTLPRPPRLRTVRWRARWRCSTKALWHCASRRSISSIGCRRSMPRRCTRSAKRWPAPTRRRSPPSSTPSMPGCRSG